MKIVHILKGKANPDTMNGVNKVVHHLATEQLRLGHNVEVWGITATPERIRHQHSYPLRLFNSTKSRFFLSGEIQEALDSLTATNTITHLHSVFLPELYAVSRRLKKNGIHWVLSPHSGYAPKSMNKNRLAKFFYMRLFENRLISEALRLHAIGVSEKNDLHQIIKCKDVILIPNGQSFKEVQFKPEACVEPDERPVFCFCGRLAREHKGLDLLIQGFGKYKKNNGKGELWLIGDGVDKKELMEIAREENVFKYVRFLGPMFGNAKLTHIACADIFVHTSRWEGIPMAALEAAAIGKPLLVSKETNMGTYIAKFGNGIVLHENTTEFITKAMLELLQLYQNYNLKDMQEASIKMIKDELNWTRIAVKMINHLYGNNVFSDR